MSDNTAKTIHLSGGIERLTEKTLAAGVAPYPGMLLAPNSDDDLKLEDAQTTVSRLLCLEDSLQGGTVDDAYTAATTCNAGYMLPGAVSYVLVESGESIVIGDELGCNGAGKFEEVTGDNTALCIAMEAADLDDSGDVDTLVKVRWL